MRKVKAVSRGNGNSIAMDLRKKGFYSSRRTEPCWYLGHEYRDTIIAYVYTDPD